MNDDELQRLLSDAVSDIEPTDRLAQIRASVHPDPQVVPMSGPRPWLYAALGVAATVAVIGGVAYATGVLPGADKADDNGPAHHGGTALPTTSTTTTPPSSVPTTPSTTTATTAPSGGTQAYAVYYVAPNPKGRPVLFREFHSGASSASTASLALAGLSSPLDPDYSTVWKSDTFASATLNGDVIDVALADGSVHDRPTGMTETAAQASIQQVVYTVQAAFQKRAPVQFMLNGNPIDQVLGVPTSEPLAQGPILKTLSLMSISAPNEGDQVSGKLTVSGANNGFEGTAAIWLERNGKRYLVSPTIGGWLEPKLFPWSVTLDLSKVQPGQYTLVASNDDPSGQGRAETDTRTITVK